MKRKCETRLPRSRRGLTLVEALAAAAILGTVLAATVVAAARLQALGARADRRTEACRAADALLERWWPNRDKIERDGAGEVPNHKGWTWRTRSLRREDADRWGAAVVVVEVFAPNAADKEPAAKVEVLLPDERDAPTKSDDAR